MKDDVKRVLGPEVPGTEGMEWYEFAEIPGYLVGRSGSGILVYNLKTGKVRKPVWLSLTKRFVFLFVCRGRRIQFNANTLAYAIEHGLAPSRVVPQRCRDRVESASVSGRREFFYRKQDKETVSKRLDLYEQGLRLYRKALEEGSGVLYMYGLEHKEKAIRVVCASCGLTRVSAEHCFDEALERFVCVVTEGRFGSLALPFQVLCWSLRVTCFETFRARSLGFRNVNFARFAGQRMEPPFDEF